MTRMALIPIIAVALATTLLSRNAAADDCARRAYLARLGSLEGAECGLNGAITPGGPGASSGLQTSQMCFARLMDEARSDCEQISRQSEGRIGIPPGILENY